MSSKRFLPWLASRRAPAATIEIGKPKALYIEQAWRVEADVNGEPLWFESPDAALDPAPDAFAAAVIPAAAFRNARLIMAAPPDATLVANAYRVLEVMRGWWGWPRDPQTVLGGLVGQVSAPPDEPIPAERRVGLCFSGGVDSFYSLLRADQPIDTLVMAHGYDIPVSDDVRMQAAEDSLRQVAADLGIRAVVIRTNLRKHSLWRRSPWGRTHGGPTAALGHLLRRSLREVRISASYPRVFDQPWGSHWRIDPCWSSATLAVVHVGDEKWRTDKLLDIIDEPAVRRHLRVCRANRSPTGNCGRCEKCIRTMLIVDGAGQLENFALFPLAPQLARNIDALPKLKPDVMTVYRAFLEAEHSPEVRTAIERLLQRSGGNRWAFQIQKLWRQPKYGDI